MLIDIGERVWGWPRAGYVWGSDVYAVDPVAPVERAKGRHIAALPTPSSSETREEERADLQALFPTPVAWDGKRPHQIRRPDDAGHGGGEDLGKRGASLAEKTGAADTKGLLPNPRFVQWMMGFPFDWFD